MPRMDGEIVLIDFGLATQSIQDEDRSVDLYVLESARLEVRIRGRRRGLMRMC